MIAVQLAEQTTIEAGTLAKLDSLASAVAARVDGASPSIGLKWPSGYLSYAPKRALGILAATFPKITAIRVGRTPDGQTFAEWETGSMVLMGSEGPMHWENGSRSGTTVVIPLDRATALASESSKIADKADKLIEELGLSAKPKKPDETARLRAREAKLADEEANLSRVVARDSQYARLDTSAFERAQSLYTRRCAALSDIVCEMLHATDQPGTRFRAMLADFTPTMPASLVASALAVAAIPLSYNVKRMAAAVEWHEAARTWVNISIGGEVSKWMRRPRLDSPTHVREEYGRIIGQDLTQRYGHFRTAPTYSLGMLRGRLAIQATAKSQQETLAESRNDLLKVQADLGIVRVKLAQKATKERT